MGAWEPWLLYMLGGVTETARWTINVWDEVKRIQEFFADAETEA